MAASPPDKSPSCVRCVVLSSDLSRQEGQGQLCAGNIVLQQPIAFDTSTSGTLRHAQCGILLCNNCLSDDHVVLEEVGSFDFDFKLALNVCACTLADLRLFSSLLARLRLVCSNCRQAWSCSSCVHPYAALPALHGGC